MPPGGTGRGEMMEAIRAEGLTKRFKAAVAVADVYVAVERGEVFGVIGPNGAGKTTLIQLLTGLLDCTAGRAMVLGFDAARATEAIRERIGYISQEFTLYGTLTVEENLDFFADLHRVPSDLRARRKEELLRWSRLQPFRQRRAVNLSGGMQKKLHLCCALIHRPEILFLDEPTTGVDPVSRRELWEILYDLVAEGLTLFVATPYMDEADRCHRVALMDQGRILRCASPAALREDLKETVLELRADPLNLAMETMRQGSLPGRSYLMGDRLHILSPEGEETPVRIRRVLEANGVRVKSLHRISATMEDVFLSLLAVAKGEKLARPAGIVQGVGRKHDQGLAENAIRLEGLTKSFECFVAVDGVSLSVRRGEVFGFLGPNGSGKTTTIRMLCGLLLPTAGRAEILGHDIVAKVHQVKRRIGYMSQRFSLYRDLNVGENLDFFAGSYGVPRNRRLERKAWVLEMAGLSGLEGRLVRELSGGVRQRLALGCALLHEPEILFLDEPTGGVDPISRREFWDLIGALASQGITIFVTTHYLDEAENCHRLGLMYRGRLVAQGSPAELKEGMRAGEMLELECPEPLQALRLLRSLPQCSHVALFGNRVHLLVQDSAEAGPVIEERLRQRGITVNRLEPVPFSLEDLFVIFIEMEEQGRQSVHA